MEDTQKVVSDNEQQISDSVDNNLNNSKDDLVSYETHRRLLGEKKKEQEKRRALEEELNAIKEREKAKEEQRLRENEEWKKLAELKEQEKKKVLEEKDNVLNEYNDLTQKIVNLKKKEAFYKVLGTRVDNKYESHIPIEDIIINPDTNELDDMSINNAVEKFKKEHFILIKDTNNPRIPADAPRLGTSRIPSIEEWKKLPLKEKKELQKAVFDYHYKR